MGYADAAAGRMVFFPGTAICQQQVRSSGLQQQVRKLALMIATSAAISFHPCLSDSCSPNFLLLSPQQQQHSHNQGVVLDATNSMTGLSHGHHVQHVFHPVPQGGQHAPVPGSPVGLLLLYKGVGNS